jgi:hypothetical protein
LAFFGHSTASFLQKFDRNIGFWENASFFRRNLAKIAENCERNIDPGSLMHLNK